jgi:hypothetical protein
MNKGRSDNINPASSKPSLDVILGTLDLRMREEFLTEIGFHQFTLQKENSKVRRPRRFNCLTPITERKMCATRGNLCKNIRRLFVRNSGTPY